MASWLTILGNALLYTSNTEVPTVLLVNYSNQPYISVTRLVCEKSNYFRSLNLLSYMLSYNFRFLKLTVAPAHLWLPVTWLDLLVLSTNFRLLHYLIYIISNNFLSLNSLYCKKGLPVFPSPAGMSLTKPSLAGNNLFYSRPGRGWLVSSRLGTGKTVTFFYSV